MEELWQFLLEVGRNLFNMDALFHTLSRPEFVVATLLVVNLIVFTETGLFFCLPGDSLLVTTGLVWYQLVNNHGVPSWTLAVLTGSLSAAAIIGDTVGYWIGFKTGPRIFRREKSLLFAKDHLLKAQAFYERHGGKTIILARFIPIIRTFAPMVAGAGRMQYRRFLYYNIFGGIGWVVSMLVIGYALTPFLDPMLKPIFGAAFRVQDHVEKVIIIVVLISISPGFVAWARSKFFRAPKPEPAAVDLR